MDHAPRPRILVVSGSARQDSHVHEIVRIAAETAERAGAEVELLRLHELALPVMRHGDADQDALPPVQAVRARWDPARSIRSAQSVRVLGDPP